MKPTLLLTGATGFVGQPVLEALQGRAAELRVIVRPQSARAPAASSCTRLIHSADIFAESSDWWARAADGVDAVLHMAWYAEPGQYLQSPRNLDCLAGTLAMAKGCAQAGVSRFVGIGTCMEYDTSEGRLSTHTPLRPASPYAAAKAAAYLSLREFFRERKISFAWCRLFYLYGENEDPRRLFPYVRRQLEQGLPVELTKGLQIRDYMDVRDAARELSEQLLGQDEDAINVCSGQGVTVRELVERLADGVGRRDLLRFGARPENFIDPPVVVGVKDRA